MNDGPELPVDLFRAGDRDAAERVFESLKPFVKAIAHLELTSPQDVEDVTQEVFRRALASAHTLEEASKIRPWILSIARNCAADLRKKSELRRRLRKKLVTYSTSTGCALDQPDNMTESPETAALTRERERRVRNAIDSLPEPYRLPVALRVLQERSYRDIAALLNLPLTSVKNCMARGGRLLIERLRSDDDLFEGKRS